MLARVALWGSVLAMIAIAGIRQFAVTRHRSLLRNTARIDFNHGRYYKLKHAKVPSEVPCLSIHNKTELANLASDVRLPSFWFSRQSIWPWRHFLFPEEGKERATFHSDGKQYIIDVDDDALMISEGNTVVAFETPRSLLALLNATCNKNGADDEAPPDIVAISGQWDAAARR